MNEHDLLATALRDEPPVTLTPDVVIAAGRSRRRLRYATMAGGVAGMLALVIGATVALGPADEPGLTYASPSATTSAGPTTPPVDDDRLGSPGPPEGQPEPSRPGAYEPPRCPGTADDKWDDIQRKVVPLPDESAFRDAVGKALRAVAPDVRVTYVGGRVPGERSEEFRSKYGLPERPASKPDSRRLVYSFDGTTSLLWVEVVGWDGSIADRVKWEVEGRPHVNCTPIVPRTLPDGSQAVEYPQGDYAADGRTPVNRFTYVLQPDRTASASVYGGSRTEPVLDPSDLPLSIAQLNAIALAAVKAR